MAVRPTAVPAFASPHAPRAPRVRLEPLERRQLLAVISVTDFGATPNDGTDDGHAIQAAINTAAAGDTVSFPAGEFNASSTLTFKGGATYKGVTGSTSLKFSLRGRQYGGTVLGNAANVVIEGLKFDGGGISLSQGGHFRNIKIINNEITNTAGTAGVYASIPSEGLIVEGNKIHSFNGWGAILWHMNNGSFSHNKMCAITQGAHIMAPRDNNHVSFNVGRHIHRMGIEMQAHGGSIARNTTVEGNVFSDWRLPHHDSFGLSIVPDNSLNTRVINNYLSANHVGAWGENTNGNGQRYGYGIEAGFATGEVSGNVISGPFANHVVVSHRNTVVKNNRFYGVPAWRDYIAGEPGPGGVGNAIESGNTVGTLAETPANTAPDPCAGIPGGGGIGLPFPTPLPTPIGRIEPPTNLAAKAANSNRIDLTWKDNSNNEIGFKIERSFFGATGPFTQIAVVTTGTQRWSNFGLPSNKSVWYRVRAYGPPGNSEYSNVVEAKTPALNNGGGFGGLARGNNGGGGNAFTGGSDNDSRNPFSDLLI